MAARKQRTPQASQDALLVVLRNLHEGLMGLIERSDFQAFVKGNPDTSEALRGAVTLLYDLRAGRAIEVAGSEPEGDRP